MLIAFRTRVSLPRIYGQAVGPLALAASADGTVRIGANYDGVPSFACEDGPRAEEGSGLGLLIADVWPRSD